MAGIDGNGNQNINFGFMKLNYWLMVGLMAATGAIAQNNTNTLPEMPVPATSPAAEVAPAAAPTAHAKAPAKKSKPAAPKKINEPTVALVPGPATVAVSNINVRGQAGTKGEVLAHLFKGDLVTVLGQINLAKHPAGEPGQWAKIALPSVVHVWANRKFIDRENKVVSSKKLNLRAGPGENFSVLGTIERWSANSKPRAIGSRSIHPQTPTRSSPRCISSRNRPRRRNLRHSRLQFPNPSLFRRPRRRSWKLPRQRRKRMFHHSRAS
jgi:hypothetical protein